VDLLRVQDAVDQAASRFLAFQIDLLRPPPRDVSSRDLDPGARSDGILGL